MRSHTFKLLLQLCGVNFSIETFCDQVSITDKIPTNLIILYEKKKIVFIVYT